MGESPPTTVYPPVPPPVAMRSGRVGPPPGIGLLLTVSAALLALVTLVLPTRQAIVRGFQRWNLIRPVGPVRPWPGILSRQHRDLIAQHQQLGVLSSCRPREQHHPLGQSSDSRRQLKIKLEGKIWDVRGSEGMLSLLESGESKDRMFRQIFQNLFAGPEPRMLTTVSSVIGLFGLAISIGLLAWQTREVAQQTKINNAIARISALNQNSDGLRAVLDHLVREPALRPYFYDGEPLPRRGRRRHQVLTIAEEFGDVLNEAVVTFSTIASAAGFRQRADWLDYCQTMLITCPTLADLSKQHPAWWPELNELSRQINPIHSEDSI